MKAEAKKSYKLTYAMYLGDKFLCIGTRKECAATLGISISSMESRISKSKSGKISYENQLIAVKLDGEVEE